MRRSHEGSSCDETVGSVISNSEIQPKDSLLAASHPDLDSRPQGKPIAGSRSHSSESWEILSQPSDAGSYGVESIPEDILGLKEKIVLRFENQELKEAEKMDETQDSSQNLGNLTRVRARRARSDSAQERVKQKFHEKMAEARGGTSNDQFQATSVDETVTDINPLQQSQSETAEADGWDDNWGSFDDEGEDEEVQASLHRTSAQVDQGDLDSSYRPSEMFSLLHAKLSVVEQAQIPVAAHSDITQSEVLESSTEQQIGAVMPPSARDNVVSGFFQSEDTKAEFSGTVSSNSALLDSTLTTIDKNEHEQAEAAPAYVVPAYPFAPGPSVFSAQLSGNSESSREHLFEQPHNSVTQFSSLHTQPSLSNTGLDSPSIMSGSTFTTNETLRDPVSGSLAPLAHSGDPFASMPSASDGRNAYEFSETRRSGQQNSKPPSPSSSKSNGAFGRSRSSSPSSKGRKSFVCPEGVAPPVESEGESTTHTSTISGMIAAAIELTKEARLSPTSKERRSSASIAPEGMPSPVADIPSSLSGSPSSKKKRPSLTVQPEGVTPINESKSPKGQTSPFAKLGGMIGDAVGYITDTKPPSPSSKNKKSSVMASPSKDVESTWGQSKSAQEAPPLWQSAHSGEPGFRTIVPETSPPSFSIDSVDTSSSLPRPPGSHPETQIFSQSEDLKLQSSLPSWGEQSPIDLHPALSSNAAGTYTDHSITSTSLAGSDHILQGSSDTPPSPKLSKGEAGEFQVRRAQNLSKGVEQQESNSLLADLTSKNHSENVLSFENDLQSSPGAEVGQIPISNAISTAKTHEATEDTPSTHASQILETLPELKPITRSVEEEEPKSDRNDGWDWSEGHVEGKLSRGSEATISSVEERTSDPSDASDWSGRLKLGESLPGSEATPSNVEDPNSHRNIDFYRSGGQLVGESFPGLEATNSIVKEPIFNPNVGLDWSGQHVEAEAPISPGSAATSEAEYRVRAISASLFGEDAASETSGLFQSLNNTARDWNAGSFSQASELHNLDSGHASYDTPFPQFGEQQKPENNIFAHASGEATKASDSDITRHEPFRPFGHLTDSNDEREALTAPISEPSEASGITKPADLFLSSILPSQESSMPALSTAEPAQDYSRSTDSASSMPLPTEAGGAHYFGVESPTEESASSLFSSSQFTSATPDPPKIDTATFDGDKHVFATAPGLQLPVDNPAADAGQMFASALFSSPSRGDSEGHDSLPSSSNEPAARVLTENRGHAPELFAHSGGELYESESELATSENIFDATLSAPLSESANTGEYFGSVPHELPSTTLGAFTNSFSADTAQLFGGSEQQEELNPFTSTTATHRDPFTPVSSSVADADSLTRAHASNNVPAFSNYGSSSETSTSIPHFQTTPDVKEDAAFSHRRSSVGDASTLFASSDDNSIFGSFPATSSSYFQNPVVSSDAFFDRGNNGLFPANDNPPSTNALQTTPGIFGMAPERPSVATFKEDMSTAHLSWSDKPERKQDDDLAANTSFLAGNVPPRQSSNINQQIERPYTSTERTTSSAPFTEASTTLPLPAPISPKQSSPKHLRNQDVNYVPSPRITAAQNYVVEPTGRGFFDSPPPASTLFSPSSETDPFSMYRRRSPPRSDRGKDITADAFAHGLSRAQDMFASNPSAQDSAPTSADLFSTSSEKSAFGNQGRDTQSRDIFASMPIDTSGSAAPAPFSSAHGLPPRMSPRKFVPPPLSIPDSKLKDTTAHPEFSLAAAPVSIPKSAPGSRSSSPRNRVEVERSSATPSGRRSSPTKSPSPGRITVSSLKLNADLHPQSVDQLFGGHEAVDSSNPFLQRPGSPRRDVAPIGDLFTQSEGGGGLFDVPPAAELFGHSSPRNSFRTESMFESSANPAAESLFASSSGGAVPVTGSNTAWPPAPSQQSMPFDRQPSQHEQVHQTQTAAALFSGAPHAPGLTAFDAPVPVQNLGPTSMPYGYGSQPQSGASAPSYGSLYPSHQQVPSEAPHIRGGPSSAFGAPAPVAGQWGNQPESVPAYGLQAVSGFAGASRYPGAGTSQTEFDPHTQLPLPHNTAYLAPRPHTASSQHAPAATYMSPARGPEPHRPTTFFSPSQPGAPGAKVPQSQGFDASAFFSPRDPNKQPGQGDYSTFAAGYAQPPPSFGSVGVNTLDVIRRQSSKNKQPGERQESWNTGRPQTAQPQRSNSAHEEFGSTRSFAGDSSKFARYRDPRLKPPAALISFGFGGRLIVMHPKQKVKLINVGGVPQSESDAGAMRKGPVRIYLLKHLLAREPSTEQTLAFPGPLVSGRKIKSDAIEAFVTARLQDVKSCATAMLEDEYLLWSLMHLLLKRGTLKGNGNVNDANSPEAAVLQLVNERAKVNVSSPLPPPRLRNARREEELFAAYQNVQSFLQAGDREAAVTAALTAELYEMALLIAATISQDSYKRVVSQYVHSTYAIGDPVGVIFSMFAGQGAKSVQEPSRLNALGSGTSQPSVLDRWLPTIAMLVANPSGAGTDEALQELGDRLWAERGRHGAAHFCYLLASLPMEMPGPTSRLSLIGGDHKSSAARRTYVTPSALQMTEIYEWVKKQEHPQSCLLTVQGYKLLYAMSLADLGELDLALQYVISMTAICKSAMGGPGNKAQPSPYAESILRQLAVFEDRLRENMGEEKAEEATNKRVDKVIEKLADDSPKPSAQSQPPQQRAAFQLPPQQMVPPLPPPPPLPLATPNQPLQTLPADIRQSPPKRNNSSPSLSKLEPVDAQKPNRAPSPVPSSSPPKDESDSLSKGKTTPPKDDSRKKSSAWSITNWLSAKVIQSQNPNAKVAKLGNEMQAYYDENLKRWVFPGEEAPTDSGPPKAPPTAAELASAAPPSGPGLAASVSAPEGSDPLAALMAPPPVRMPAGGSGPMPPQSAGGGNPLSAMMAPPPRSVNSMYGRGGGGRGPRPPPRGFAVFKPVATSSASTTETDNSGPPPEGQ